MKIKKFMTGPTIIGIHGKKNHGKNWFAEQIAEVLNMCKVREFAFADSLKAMCAVLTNKPVEDFYNREKKEEVLTSVEHADTCEVLADMLAILTLAAPTRFSLDDKTTIPYFEMSPVSMMSAFRKAINYESGSEFIRVRGKRVEFSENMTHGRLLQLMGTEVVRMGVHTDAWIISVRLQIEEAGTVISLVTDVRFPNEVDFVNNLGGLVIRVEAPELEVSSRDAQHASEVACDELEMLTFVNDRSMKNNNMVNEIFRPSGILPKMFPSMSLIEMFKTRAKTHLEFRVSKFAQSQISA